MGQINVKTINYGQHFGIRFWSVRFKKIKFSPIVNYITQILVVLITVFGCSRQKVFKRERAMRPISIESLQKNDDEIENIVLFKTALEESLKNFHFLKSDKLYFGHCFVQTSDYYQFLIQVRDRIIDTEDTSLASLKELNISAFEVYGHDRYGEILLTSYFSPVYEARSHSTEEFSQPIYRLPQDLIEISLDQFSKEELVELNNERPVISGRVMEGPGRIKRVVPYYTRKEIDIENKLDKLGLELAYLKPIDAFFLQIQGSGSVLFPNGEKMHVGYAGQNGHKYKSIGKLLYDVIPKEEMSMAKIEEYLSGLSHEELQIFLSKNPSYIFFEELKGEKGLTTLGHPVVNQTTLAVDPRVFPLGGLGLLLFNKPLFESDSATVSIGHEEKRHLIFAHDTGGAIKGAGRADLYWGAGKKAQQIAGVIKDPAQLIFLAPKDRLVCE